MVNWKSIPFIGLVVSAGFLVILSLTFFNIYYKDPVNFTVEKNSGLLTLISVISAFFLFYLKLCTDDEEHTKKQKDLLRSLLYEIRPLIGRREEMNSQLEWIKNNIITDHSVRKINTNLYISSLDAEIEGKRIDEIIIKLLKIEDKLELINFYADERRKYFYNNLNFQRYKEYHKEFSNKTYDDFINDQFKNDVNLLTLNEKINSTSEDAEKNLTELRCILKERFGIEETNN